MENINTRYLFHLLEKRRNEQKSSLLEMCETAEELKMAIFVDMVIGTICLIKCLESLMGFELELQFTFSFAGMVSYYVPNKFYMRKIDQIAERKDKFEKFLQDISPLLHWKSVPFETSKDIEEGLDKITEEEEKVGFVHSDKMNGIIKLTFLLIGAFFYFATPSNVHNTGAYPLCFALCASETIIGIKDMMDI